MLSCQAFQIGSHADIRNIISKICCYWFFHFLNSSRSCKTTNIFVDIALLITLNMYINCVVHLTALYAFIFNFFKLFYIPLDISCNLFGQLWNLRRLANGILKDLDSTRFAWIWRHSFENKIRKLVSKIILHLLHF